MKRKHRKAQQDLPGLMMLIAFGFVAVIFVCVLFYFVPKRPLTKRAVAGGRIPPFLSSVAAAQPLPATLDPAKFNEPSVKRAYAVARTKPNLLAQQPCYCGCSDQNHRSLLDCFKNYHAAGCSICLREANYAAELDAHGKCAADIREGIIRGDWKSLERSSN